ncbi:hypothetical protein CHREV_275 [Choristoneura rosaceana entomopoxvirus 'L']|uniref:Uncharacterized protein n=1 Tax=Choristoneura rosaceana entomopoxvirus 'L' TaxID=1293539 RepID=A0ABM9QKW1_9POXV|nr:hypothetical protein CHREV_275 [Choristoneura rosaceana entomopoxvirus 'L']CCU56177.1 hypothetical protein CHREV_275 [Choristoneura rosaceana entomopoxvirus 'L']
MEPSKLNFIFKFMFDILNDNPNLITNYIYNIMHDYTSFNIGDFLQNTLTTDINKNEDLLSDDDDNISYKSVYKLSFKKLDNAQKCLIRIMITNLRLNLSSHNINERVLKDIQYFINLIEIFSFGYSTDDSFTTEFILNSKDDDDDDDDDDNDDNNEINKIFGKRMLNFINEMNIITGYHLNYILDNLINTIIYLSNVIIPLTIQNNNNCIISSDTHMYKIQ